MCRREKSECKSCSENKDGFCVRTERNVDDMYKQWLSSKKSKIRKKIRQNERFFDEKLADNIYGWATCLSTAEMESVDYMKAMNALKLLIDGWRIIDIDTLLGD